MRVTSHCVNHPSKEAGQRCRSCRKWLCDVCLQRYRGRVYCGRKCQILGTVGDGIDRAIASARRPLHAAWVIAVVAGASALLLSAVGIKVAELVEVSREVEGSRVEGVDRVEISAEIVVSDDGLRIESQGPPGTRALLLLDGRSLGVVTFDEEGHASSEGLELSSGEGPLRVVPLTDEGLVLVLPTPTATATATATPEPSPKATPRPAPASRTDPRMVPTPMVAPPVLQLVQDAGPRIAITFDGNASTNRTAELLDLLQQHDLEVTIFVTGQFIERYPSIIRRAVLSGHEIGNHTYSHPHLTTYAKDRRHRLLPEVTKKRFQEELRRTEEAFVKATGHSMQPLWRSPYGEENRALRGWALEMGYLHVRWSSLEGASLDSHDWVADEHSSLYKSSRRIMERLIQFPKLEGGIILMHMATEREEPPWEELPVFLDALKQRGLEPTTVTRLLEASPTWSKWLRRAKERHRRVNGD
jgi:peptidoglycan/xylan/chitin deacetylase (PgdA/CDA1 family)